MSKTSFRMILLVVLAATTVFAFAETGECGYSAAPHHFYENQIYLGDIGDKEKDIHTVKEGDTLYDIARSYNVALVDLMVKNNLNTCFIRPGDVIVLPPAVDSEVLSRGSVTREDLMLLARIIHAEARGESFEGKVAVGAVVLNRLNSPYYPKTIREVIYQKTSSVYQFSPVGDGTINLNPDDSAIQAAIQALSGMDPTGGALFFYNPDISTDRWITTLPVITRIGNHVFATAS